MNDVSILLNLTGKIAFERANPLMDVVSGHGPYLFYDQLSTERFPAGNYRDPLTADGHAITLLSRLRNLLENRCLSVEDKGGKIRLMVLLDMAGSFLHQPGQAYCFPAQKVRLIKNMIADVFKENMRLLSRFVYTFLFVECVDEGNSDSEFYRVLAYDGCDGMSDKWLSATDFDANTLKAQFLGNLNSPSEEWPLSGSKVNGAYMTFRQELQEKVEAVAARLAMAGAGEAFTSAVIGSLNGLKTIGDVARLDFDQLLRSEVGRLIGLKWASDGDSTFFICKYRTSTESERQSDEMVIVSLLQMLGTMRDEDYPRFSGIANQLQRAKLFVVDSKMNVSELDKEALTRLKHAAMKCRLKLKQTAPCGGQKTKTFPTTYIQTEMSMPLRPTPARN